MQILLLLIVLLVIVYLRGGRGPTLISKRGVRCKGLIVDWCYGKEDGIPSAESDMAIGSASIGVEDSRMQVGLQEKA